MSNHYSIPSSYRCQLIKPDGLVNVLNENSYVMGEYNQKTGIVSWQRVVPAAQRATIEQWLIAHYPVKGKAAPATA
ncbi:MAG TPA: hypothetical protein VM120_04975 [Bryobacteraceae bacterium]|nr:hypothetical protein [Bryobacteraceae bacterium]